MDWILEMLATIKFRIHFFAISCLKDPNIKNSKTIILPNSTCLSCGSKMGLSPEGGGHALTKVS
jgi:hypothetical protein